MVHSGLISNYQKIAALSEYFVFPKSNKSVTTFKKIIDITTDKKSVTESKKLLESLNNTIKELPTKKNEFKIDLIKQQINDIKENQLKINQMFETIDNLFDNENNVIIDDSNMILLLSNMKDVKEKLAYIYEYLTLIVEVNESSIECEKNGKSYTFEEFTLLLTNAA